jgi:hypothetical protein
MQLLWDEALQSLNPESMDGDASFLLQALLHGGEKDGGTYVIDDEVLVTAVLQWSVTCPDNFDRDHPRLIVQQLITAYPMHGIELQFLRELCVAGEEFKCDIELHETTVGSAIDVAKKMRIEHCICPGDNLMGVPTTVVWCYKSVE